MSTQLDTLRSKTEGASLQQRQMVTLIQNVWHLALDILMEHRRAKAAENVYSHLSAMSDDELAHAGLRRSEIATYVRRRLYGA